MSEKKPVIYAVTNQKGGIGKTTTATCTAAILQEMGKKVLLVDTDVQCNSTNLYRAQIEGAATLYDLILEKDDPCTPAEAIQHTQFGDIIASDPTIEGADIKVETVDDFFKDTDVFRLRNALRQVKEYDYIIIDTNPSLNYMLYNALAAADEAIIPLTADFFAIQGLSQLTKTISLVQQMWNPGLKVAGLLLVAYSPNRNLDKQFREDLRDIARDQIGTKLFKTYIRSSVKVREAQAERTPLIKYAKTSNPEKDYEAFVKELIG